MSLHDPPPPPEESDEKKTSADSLANEEETKLLCHVCGMGNDNANRRALCHFVPTEDAPQEIFLHVFCGKTAAILPHVNRPDLEILTKAGIKNKHGTGVSVTLALQRCRSAKVYDPSNREQEYFLSKEFERIYLAVTKEPPHTAAPTAPTADASLPNLDVDMGDMAAPPINVPNPMYPHTDGSHAVSPEEQVAPSESPAIFPDPHRPLPDDGRCEEPAAKKRKENKKSPYDLAMERLQRVCDRCHGVGYSLVRGVARQEGDDEDDDEEEDTFDPTQCSQEQVDHVRVIVITKDRQERMEEMGRLILGDQYGEMAKFFNTSYSYDVLGAWSALRSTLSKTRDVKKKLDYMLGFTDTLKEYDCWIHDHEYGWGGDQMVKQMATQWKNILKRTDAELGIDPEYTRPGIVALLEQFKEAVEAAETYGTAPMKFRFM